MVSMLAGLETADSGDAWIEQRSIVTDLDAARRKLGLCPQFDALLPNLTAREHLNMFAKVRGVPAEMRPRIVERTIVDMGLSLKADCRVGTYSGGNKRKLSVALSMVSDPAVSFLDEPSTGMDPKTRRRMWDYLIHLKAGHLSTEPRGIVLTSHSMEEADALSDNIAIMVRGELRCIRPLAGVFYRWAAFSHTDGAVLQRVGAEPDPQEHVRRGLPRHGAAGRQRGDGRPRHRNRIHSHI